MRDWIAMRECIARHGILRAVGSVQSGTLISVRFWVWFLGHMTGHSKRITIVVSGHVHFQESHTHEAQDENEQSQAHEAQVLTTAINFSFLLGKARQSRAEHNMQLNLQRKQINEPG